MLVNACSRPKKGMRKRSPEEASDVVFRDLLEGKLTRVLFAAFLARTESGNPKANIETIRLRKNSVLSLILGGAALQRCDNCSCFDCGFSR